MLAVVTPNLPAIRILHLEVRPEVPIIMLLQRHWDKVEYQLWMQITCVCSLISSCVLTINYRKLAKDVEAIVKQTANASLKGHYLESHPSCKLKSLPIPRPATGCENGRLPLQLARINPPGTPDFLLLPTLLLPFQ